MPTERTASARYNRIRCSPRLCRKSAGRPGSPDYASGLEPAPPPKPSRSSKSPKPECASGPPSGVGAAQQTGLVVRSQFTLARWRFADGQATKKPPSEPGGFENYGDSALRITVTVHSIWKVENLGHRPGRTIVECTVTVIPPT